MIILPIFSLFFIIMYFILVFMSDCNCHLFVEHFLQGHYKYTDMAWLVIYST